MPGRRGEHVGGVDASDGAPDAARESGPPAPTEGLAGHPGRPGKVLDQWQYEVTSGGRIWYCPDPAARIVWITYASTAHPKATE